MVPSAGRSTRELVPLKLSALPYLPAVHLAPTIVPVLPLPDAFASVVPEPACSEYAATRRPAASALPADRARAKISTRGPVIRTRRSCTASDCESSRPELPLLPFRPVLTDGPDRPP